jgi:low affinity Fe/Cu permease
MEILDVNKAVYRKTLNKVIVGFVVTFAILAVLFGSVLIGLFAEPIVDPTTQSNLRYNVAGVILALICMSFLLNTYKRHERLKEVYYVWQLKQLHNKIYRKLKKIKAAAAENDVDALIILAFYFKTLKLVYELDDNTLTINAVELELEAIGEQLSPLNCDEQATKFDQKLLTSF